MIKCFPTKMSAQFRHYPTNLIFLQFLFILRFFWRTWSEMLWLTRNMPKERLWPPWTSFMPSSVRVALSTGLVAETLFIYCLFCLWLFISWLEFIFDIVINAVKDFRLYYDPAASKTFIASSTKREIKHRYRKIIEWQDWFWGVASLHLFDSVYPLFHWWIDRSQHRFYSSNSWELWMQDRVATKIMGEGHFYWIHDFYCYYQSKWQANIHGVCLIFDTGSRPSVVDDWCRFLTNNWLFRVLFWNLRISSLQLCCRIKDCSSEGNLRDIATAFHAEREAPFIEDIHNFCLADDCFGNPKAVECDTSDKFEYFKYEDFNMNSSILTDNNALCMKPYGTYIHFANSCLFIGFLFGGSLFGMISDRFGRRNAIGLSIFTAFFGTGLGGVFRLYC